MPGFSVYQDSYIGATIISNRFIDEYMTDANDAQLKVYLYLVRMLNAHLETSVSDIADRFNHTEKDVVRAFKYWEKRGLLTIDYDEENNLTGVHLTNLCKSEAAGPTVEETHKKVKSEAKPSAANIKKEKTPEPEAEKQSSDIIMEKPSYGAKELEAFSDAGGKQLVFLAQMYFSKPVTQSDMQSLAYISEGLGMSDDLVDYLLQYCAEKGKRDFRYAEKVAIGWKERGIETVEQARTGNYKYDKTVYEIMNRLGKNGSPTEKEMEFISKWRDEYSFSDVVIFEACDRTVMATDSHRFQYAEGILSKWFKQGIRTIEDVVKAGSDFKASSSSSSDGSGTLRSSGKKNSAGSFGNYRQNDIDLDELSKKIFAN